MYLVSFYPFTYKIYLAKHKFVQFYIKLFYLRESIYFWLKTSDIKRPSPQMSFINTSMLNQI